MRTTTLDAAQRHYDNLTPADDIDHLDRINDWEYRKLQKFIARQQWESIIESVIEQVDLLPAFEAGPVTLGSLIYTAINEQLNDRIEEHLDAEFRSAE
jgi:hypothetical protein